MFASDDINASPITSPVPTPRSTRRHRFEGRKVFLTYQKVQTLDAFYPDLSTPEALLKHFEDVLPPIEFYSIGKEEYPNSPGEYHIHAQLIFFKKEKIPWSKFEYRSLVPFNKSYKKPNGQPDNSKEAVVKVHEYCIKGGDFVTNFDPDDYLGRKKSWWKAIYECETKEEGYEKLLEHYPMYAILQKRNFDYFAAYRWPEEQFMSIDPIDPPSPVCIPPEVQAWKDVNLVPDFQGKLNTTYFLLTPFLILTTKPPLATERVSSLKGPS